MSILNEKKKADIYIIYDTSRDTVCEAKHGEGTSGCGFNEKELGVGQSTTRFNNVKESLVDVELGGGGEVGQEANMAHVDVGEYMTEEDEIEDNDEYIEANEEYLSDEDDFEL